MTGSAGTNASANVTNQYALPTSSVPTSRGIHSPSSHPSNRWNVTGFHSRPVSIDNSLTKTRMSCFLQCVNERQQRRMRCAAESDLNQHEVGHLGMDSYQRKEIFGSAIRLSCRPAGICGALPNHEAESNVCDTAIGTKGNTRGQSYHINKSKPR